MEQRKPALPLETLKKVTELRNGPEIVRAVEYVENELRTHLELGALTEEDLLILEKLNTVVKDIGLGQTNFELSSSIDELVSTVRGLNQANLDLLTGAQAQAEEFGEELEKLKTQQTSSSKVSLSDIASELTRREEMRNQVAETQERFENDKDEMVEKIRTLNQLLQHKACDDEKKVRDEKKELERNLSALMETIGTIVNVLAESDREIGLLISYRNAILLINQGLPEGVIGREFRFTNKK